LTGFGRGKVCAVAVSNVDPSVRDAPRAEKNDPLPAASATLETFKRRSYKTPIPIPADPEPTDVSVQQAMWFGDWSPRQVFRLIEPPGCTEIAMSRGERSGAVEAVEAVETYDPEEMTP
jgi:hypothetical protein